MTAKKATEDVTLDVPVENSAEAPVPVNGDEVDEKGFNHYHDGAYGEAVETMPYDAYSATTFDELEEAIDAKDRAYEIGRLTDHYKRMIGNVMRRDDVADKEAGIQTLTAQFVNRISTSSDKETTTEDDDKVQEASEYISLNELVEAARGDEKSFPEKLTGFFKGIFGKNPEPSLAHKDTGILIWKEKGEEKKGYRWVTRYSNNIRDRDNPPEIISEVSHQEFVKAVDAGEVDLPQLWMFHRPEWAIGQADWVAYDNGFAIAGGYSYPGKEYDEAMETLASLPPEKVRVSHGMLKESIERDEDDPTIITRHVTYEISPLPAEFAANIITGFTILDEPQKEKNMAIPEKKREALEGWGLSTDVISRIEEINEADSIAADDKGLDRKQVDPTKDGEDTAAEATEETPPVTDGTIGSMTADELLGVFEAGIAPLVERVEALESGEKAKEDETEDPLKGLTPAASIAARLAQSTSKTVEDDEEDDDTFVDGRSKLAKSKPKENTEAVAGPTSLPFVNKMLAESGG